MNLLQRRTSAYFEHDILLHSKAPLKEFNYNGCLLRAEATPATRIILFALEGIGSLDAIRRKFVDGYNGWCQETEHRYADYALILRKEMKLIQASIGPILTAHNEFVKLYGEDAVSQIGDKLRITYWKNDKLGRSSEQLSIITTVTGALVNITDRDALENVNRAAVRAVPGNWTYTSSWNMEAPKANYRMADLGYDIPQLVNEGTLLTEDASVTRLLDYHSLAVGLAKIRNWINVQPTLDKATYGAKLSKEEVSLLQRHTLDTSLASVMLYDLANSLHRVSYMAYEALYKLHLAEVEFSRQ